MNLERRSAPDLDGEAMITVFNYPPLPSYETIWHGWFSARQISFDHASLLSAEVTRERNKAVYTTASVAYGWAGAVMQVRSLFGLNSRRVTDRQSD